jgi:transcriptional regulator with XRE-family HTH domain
LGPLAKQALFYFRENLKRIRKEKGLTQIDLAKRAGLSHSTIAEIEQGRMLNVTMDTYFAIVEALGFKQSYTHLLEKPPKQIS